MFLNPCAANCRFNFRNEAHPPEARRRFAPHRVLADARALTVTKELFGSRARSLAMIAVEQWTMPSDGLRKLGYTMPPRSILLYASANTFIGKYDEHGVLAWLLSFLTPYLSCIRACIVYVLRVRVRVCPCVYEGADACAYTAAAGAKDNYAAPAHMGHWIPRTCVSTQSPLWRSEAG